MQVFSKILGIYPESKYYNLKVQSKKHRKSLFIETANNLKSQISDYYQYEEVSHEEAFEEEYESSSEESFESSDSLEAQLYHYYKEAYMNNTESAYEHESLASESFEDEDGFKLNW